MQPRQKISFLIFLSIFFFLIEEFFLYIFTCYILSIEILDTARMDRVELMISHTVYVSRGC